MLGPLAKEKLIIFFIKEAFIKISKAMHRVDTKPKG
jgi:hypothetical protein